MKTKTLLFLFFLSLCSSLVFGAIPTEERAALIELYKSTNGDSWTNNTGWKTPPLYNDGFALPGTEGNWYGVTLTGDNVTALKLPDNQLKGFIPKELGDLKKLEHLDLLRNHLRGGIPLSLDKIKSLKHLDVDSDQSNDAQIAEDIPIPVSRAGYPDLTPYKPPVLPNTIIFSNSSGTSTDDTIYAYKTYYIDYGGKNIGTADITGGFYVSMWERKKNSYSESPIFQNSYWSSPLYADYYFTGRDHQYLFTEAGWHVIRLKLDSSNIVNELNEGNNECEREVYVNPVLPLITTNSVTSITSNSAICGGIVSIEGGVPVTAKGVCWSTTSRPTINNNKTIDGSGMGSFTSYITGLNPNTKYYVRAYATNSAGTEYGLEWDFTTLPNQVNTPTVSTNSVTSKTPNSAVCGGYVSSDGGATVTARGVCWSTSQGPTIYNNKTTDGSGLGSFTSYITGLSPNTTYYARAYATNNAGTAYGIDVPFTTPPNSINTPTVSTNQVTSKTINSAVCGGNVSSDGGATVTARGVCWSTSQGPTIYNNKTTDGSGLGSFTSYITGLSPNTTYYYMAYATNSEGTAYGGELNFTTPPNEIKKPTVSTNSVTSITHNSAVCGGNVTAKGSSDVTARGVCWSTSQNPTISNSKTTDGSGLGSFTSNITGLSANTTYYVRAYATNSAGTAYGIETPFTTLPNEVNKPTVSTNSVTSITHNSAVCGGNVTAKGSSDVTARGVCWSTSLDPTINDAKTINGSGLGNFTSNITGLSPNTTYYARAYATNSAGTGYGSNVEFKTPSTVTKSIKVGDLTFYANSITQTGNEYSLSGNVNIDNKLWFSGNVQYTSGSNASGTLLSTGSLFVKLSNGEQIIYNSTNEHYTVNGVGKTLSPINLHIEFPSLFLNSIRVYSNNTPIKFDDNGIRVGGYFIIGNDNFRLGAANIELLLKPGGRIYLSHAELAAGVVSNIPSIKLTSLSLVYDFDTKEITGSAKIDFPFLKIFSIDASVSFKPGCFDGFSVTVGGPKGYPLGASGLEISALTIEIDNLCNPPKFYIFFGGDIKLLLIPSQILSFSKMGLGYQHPYRLNIEAGTVTFLGYPIASARGYFDASDNINEAGCAISGNINLKDMFIADIDIKRFTKIPKLYGRAKGTLQIPDYECRSEDCTHFKAIIGKFLGFPFKLYEEEMDIEVWDNNNIWSGRFRGTTSVFGIPISIGFIFENNDIYFSVGKNFENILKIFSNRSEYKIMANSVEQSINLPSPTESIIFSAHSKTILPQIYLKTPSGEIITPDNVNNFGSVHHIEDGKSLVSLFILKSASAGEWTIGANNLSSSEVDFGIYARRILPKTSFINVTKSGNNVKINASVNPGNSDTKVSLFFSERSSGGTGNLIAEKLSAVNGLISSTWDTISVPSGTYYLFAKTDDDLNAPVLIYYDYPIVIDNNGIKPPQNLQGLASGDTVELTWTPSTTSSVVGYKILYTDEPHIGGYKYQKSSIANNQATITGLDQNKSYRFCAVAFDERGNSSIESNSFTTSSSSAPQISLNRTSLNFGAIVSRNDSPIQSIIIYNTGTGTLNWNATSNSSWLLVTPSSGTGNSIISVSVNPNGLNAGIYNGTITISAADAINSPQTINVTLHVYNQNTTSAPFGDFATPIDGSYTYNSIPITGWALDDIGIENVKIYNSDTYIGDAVFIEGARPDVETAYPEFPNNYKAGWGYMLLTHFLPNGGNGIYTLIAKATDKEGNVATLGSKTIFIDNAHAVKPFGAIDTPAQGGTVSGYTYRNAGWVITPMPNSIPTDGSTINVYIDGVYINKAKYNVFRQDIATLFPGYANSNAAMAYYDFNTSLFKNGVHTIAWNVTDNKGNSDGIGSRYFWVYNTSADTSKDSYENTIDSNGSNNLYSLSELDRIKNDETPVNVQIGCDETVSACPVTDSNNGSLLIPSKELERLEINLAMGECKGYMVVNDRLKALPAGSTLKEGIFYWQPGPGFVGEYHFIFVSNDEMVKKRIVIEIAPKFSKNF